MLIVRHWPLQTMETFMRRIADGTIQTEHLDENRAGACVRSLLPLLLSGFPVPNVLLYDVWTDNGEKQIWAARTSWLLAMIAFIEGTPLVSDPTSWVDPPHKPIPDILFRHSLPAWAEYHIRNTLVACVHLSTHNEKCPLLKWQEFITEYSKLSSS